MNICVSSVSQDGLTFTNPDFAGQAIPRMGVFSSGPNFTVPSLIFGAGNYPIWHTAITATGGGAFDLNSLQMTLSYYDTLVSDTVAVTAHFESGATSTLTLLLGQRFQSYDFEFRQSFGTRCHGRG
jgi:hypothetical protein